MKEDEDPEDILRTNIIALVGLFRIMLAGLTPEEDAIVDRAITETYALKDITVDANFAASNRRFFPILNSCSPAWREVTLWFNDFPNTPRAHGAGFMNQPDQRRH